MEPFRAGQAVLASNFQVMRQGESQGQCCTQQTYETQCFRQHVPHLPAETPKAPGTSSQDRQYYLGSRQLPVRSETRMARRVSEEERAEASYFRERRRRRRLQGTIRAERAWRARQSNSDAQPLTRRLDMHTAGPLVVSRTNPRYFTAVGAPEKAIYSPDHMSTTTCTMVWVSGRTARRSRSGSTSMPTWSCSLSEGTISSGSGDGSSFAAISWHQRMCTSAWSRSPGRGPDPAQPATASRSLIYRLLIRLT